MPTRSGKFGWMGEMHAGRNYSASDLTLKFPLHIGPLNRVAPIPAIVRTKQRGWRKEEAYVEDTFSTMPA